MAAAAYGIPAQVWGAPVPKIWKRAVDRRLFGDLVLLGFLVAQALDGVFTYLGVTIHGAGIEANPLMSLLMAQLGHAPALAVAKIIAATFGIALHLRKVHGAVAFLTCFYFAAAVLPWTATLFF